MNRFRSHDLGLNPLLLNWLHPAQLEEIHQASLELLERTGVRVEHQEAAGLLKEAGCIVRDRVARIPAWLVEACIRQAPGMIPLYSPGGEKSLTVKARNSYFGPGSGLACHLDLDSGERRRTVRQDLTHAAILLNALPRYDFVMSYGAPSDCPADKVDLYQFEAMLLHCSKPVFFASATEENTRKIIEMASIAVGGVRELEQAPFLVYSYQPEVPLVYTHDGLSRVFCCLEYKIPVIFAPTAVAGQTSPVTKAGTVLQVNAGNLAGVVLAQLKKKGASVILGSRAAPLDMKTSSILRGSPDTFIQQGLTTQLAHFYGLPGFSEAGCSNAPVPCAQAGMEAGMSILLATLNGSNLTHNLGALDGGTTGSLPFLVMCHEYIGAARHLGAGASMDRERLALDVLQEAGPGGNFAGSRHTINYFKSENWMPETLNRQPWETWEEQGKKDSFVLAREKVQKILSETSSSLLSDEKKHRIRQVASR